MNLKEKTFTKGVEDSNQDESIQEFNPLKCKD